MPSGGCEHIRNVLTLPCLFTSAGPNYRAGAVLELRSQCPPRAQHLVSPAQQCHGGQRLCPASGTWVSPGNAGCSRGASALRRAVAAVGAASTAACRGAEEEVACWGRWNALARRLGVGLAALPDFLSAACRVVRYPVFLRQPPRVWEMAGAKGNDAAWGAGFPVKSYTVV